MSEPIWYYAKNRQKAGPVTLDSLKKKLSMGELGSDDLVWTVGWEAWKKVCDVPEIGIPEPPPLPPEEPPPLPVESTPIVKESDQGQEEAPDYGLPLDYAVSIHGERPENYILLTTDKQWLELLRRSKTLTWPESWVWPDSAIRNIRETLTSQGRYGIVVEPKQGADRLKRFFGGPRMLDFRVEKKPPASLVEESAGGTTKKASKVLGEADSDRYGGGGIDWYLAALKKYAVFSGRARRKEYWWFTLLSLLFIFALGLVEGALGIAPEIDVSVLGTLYILAVAIPWAAVSVRRLHDTGRSGRWLLIGLIPLVGNITFFVFMIEDSEPGQNAYGLNPKESSD